MKRLSGFSLMEMMVVLLITAVVAAVTAPMISKKMVSSAGGDSPWMWAGLKNSIVYNVEGNSSKTANIGGIMADNTGSRLYIEVGSKHVPHATFKSSIAPSGTQDNLLHFIFNNGAIFLSNKIPTKSDIKSNFGLSTIIGMGAEAKGSEATAIGSNSSAETGGTAIGAGATAQEEGTALGNGSIAGIWSLAIGKGADASGKSALAIGYGAQAMKEGCVAITLGGENYGAKGNFSTAYGYHALANGDFSVAIGDDTTAGKDSVCIGSEADAKNKAVAIGGGADETLASDDSVAVGYNARTSAANSVAVGYSAQTTSANSVAIGSSALAKNSSIAIGYDAQATATASSYYSTAIGNSARATKDDTLAIGRESKATAQMATAIGNLAKAEYFRSTAIGYGATTTANNQIVLGDENTTVYIKGNLVVGKQTLLGADYAIQIGKVENNTTKQPLYIRLSEGRGAKHEGSLYKGNDAREIRIYEGGFEEVKKTLLSDRRLKNVGDAFKGGLAEIRKLEVFNYTFKKDPNKTPMVGVIAQDLQKIFPNAVVKGDDGFLRIRWDEIFYAMVNAIKELDIRVTNHDKKIEALEKQNLELQKKLDKLEQRLDKLEKKCK